MFNFSIKEQKLNNTWDNLSLADKSQVMKVAVANGLTSLSDIREKYNKFAEGGDLTQGVTMEASEESPNLLNMPWHEIYPDVSGGINYPTPIKRAVPVKQDANYNHAVAVYQGLLNRGIPEQAAFELTNQKILEGGWKSLHTGDGKHYKDMNKLLDHIASWMKTSYPDTIKAKNFNEFYNGLMNGKNGKYNDRPAYKQELLNTRKGVLRRINNYRGTKGQKPLTLLNDNPFNAPIGINGYVSPQETLLTPIVYSNIAAYGGNLKRKRTKRSYDDWANKLSSYWGEDLNTHDYDYKKYYNDNPKEAYKQLNHILSGGHGHFPDDGKSGTYKKVTHPTYPDLGEDSWSDNDTKFHISDRQLEGDTDRILNYLGEDLYYNGGGTKVMYDNSYVLPSITVTPNESYSNLVPNKYHTGYVYEDNPNRAYAEGDNLYAKGGKMNSKRRTPNTNTQAALGYLMSKGISKTGASAIVGVLQSESNLNPSVRAQMKGDNGEGIAQWTGNRKTVFWNTLEKIEPGAKKKYGSIVNVPLQRQLDVVLKERPTITKAIHNAKDVQTATDIMLRGYENGGGTLNTMISKGQMDEIYSKYGNGYNSQMKNRLSNAYNLLGVKVDPNNFNFSDDYNTYSDISGLPESIQIPYPTVNLDPTTNYQPPTIDSSIFNKPKVVEVPVYDPQQERQENLQGLNTAMSLLGQGNVIPTISNKPQGLLDYVNAIYS